METIEKLKGSNRRAVVVLRRKLFKNDGSCDISALWKQNHSLREVSGTSFPRQDSPTTTYRSAFLNNFNCSKRMLLCKSLGASFHPLCEKRLERTRASFNIWDLQFSGNGDPIKKRPSLKSVKCSRVCLREMSASAESKRKDLCGFGAGKVSHIRAIHE